MDDLRSRSLLGLSDRQLLMGNGQATHQHYKGGLYKLLGPLWSADSGQRFEVSVNMNEGPYEPVVAYQHIAPHAQDIWMRRASEFDGMVDTPEWHPAYSRTPRITTLQTDWEGVVRWEEVENANATSRRNQLRMRSMKKLKELWSRYTRTPQSIKCKEGQRIGVHGLVLNGLGMMGDA